MTPKRSTLSELILIAKKFLTSAFVVFSFAIYAIHERIVSPAANADSLTDPQVAALDTPEAPVPTPTAAPPSDTPLPPTATATSTATAQPQATQVIMTSIPLHSTTVASPTATSVPPSPIPPTATRLPPTATRILPTATLMGLYRDGQYIGDVADAFYGQVQIKVTVLQGKITSVVFLDYPHDRRTSQFINSQAMPYLKVEAVKAQSANVNIISGATLTSDAFIESLQSALDKAKA